MEVRLGDDDRPGGSEARHLKGVFERDEAFEGDRSGRGRQVVRAHVVLEDDRDPVQRAPGAAGGPFGVQGGGLASGLGVDRDECVEHRAAVVVRSYAGEVEVDESEGGDPPCVHRLLDLEDRRSQGIEWQDRAHRGGRAGGDGGRRRALRPSRRRGRRLRGCDGGRSGRARARGQQRYEEDHVAPHRRTVPGVRRSTPATIDGRRLTAIGKASWNRIGELRAAIELAAQRSAALPIERDLAVTCDREPSTVNFPRARRRRRNPPRGNLRASPRSHRSDIGSSRPG